MELVITNTLKALIFPPGLFFSALLLGLLLLPRRPRLARLLLWTGLLCGYLLSTPYIAGALRMQLQAYGALTPAELGRVVAESRPQAIVVLSADRYKEAPEYGGDTVGDATLERIRYGAFLQRQTGLPLLVSGGHVLDSTGESLAAVMEESLKRDFGIAEVWVEDRSRTTAENAIYSQQLLQARGIERVLLVTHAYHMPRAVAIFEKSGLTVVAAPTRLILEREGDAPAYFDWLPNAGALQGSYIALHELTGRLWYWLRY